MDTSPIKSGKTPSGKEFKVELVLIDDPVAMVKAYAAGEVHIGWGTLDMVPLFVDGFVKSGDSRIQPRIYQQIDWSNGGDGIVVRENIKTVADLRGKKIVFGPKFSIPVFCFEHACRRWSAAFGSGNDLHQHGHSKAARAFAVQKDIAAAVSWAPDIYNLADVKGNRLLVTTQTANKLIADIWFARADFAKDHPDIVEGLVRGIFDGMEDMKVQDRLKYCAKLMSDLYTIPEAETIKMFGDAHNTNWAENYQFFLNQNNPTNFERIWRQSYYLYKRIGTIQNENVPFDAVMDYSIIAKLGKEQKYSSQKDEYQFKLTPKTVSEIKAESDEILTNTWSSISIPIVLSCERKLLNRSTART